MHLGQARKRAKKRRKQSAVRHRKIFLAHSSALRALQKKILAARSYTLCAAEKFAAYFQGLYSAVPPNEYIFLSITLAITLYHNNTIANPEPFPHCTPS